MFKHWSIKNLLQLWSFATILAIIVIASVAIYTDSLYSKNQVNLTDKVLPIENASKKISTVAFSFITRQKQVIASHSLDEVLGLTPRKVLEDEFSLHWEKVASSVRNKQDSEMVDSLQQRYQSFLEVDSQLLFLIGKQHILDAELNQQAAFISSLKIKTQNQVEAISGKINLQRSKLERARRQTELATVDDFKVEQESIQRLSQSVRMNVLYISYLTEKMLQSNNADELLSLRENDIKQYERILHADINQLKIKLNNNADLLVLMDELEKGVHILMQLIIGSENSIYNLRLQKLELTRLLDISQQDSVTIIKEMTVKLDELSSLVRKQSLTVINQSKLVSDRALATIIVLSGFITLGMIIFVTSIARRINTPLAELRSAMNALSKGAFDSRLKVTSGKSEFTVLATDFNIFAENTQKLISDLDEAKNAVQGREQYISAILNSVPEAILTLSPSGIIALTNPAAERILGADSRTLIGLNINTFFQGNRDFKSVNELQDSLFESREFEGLNYHGNTFSMWLSLNKISHANNELWVCVISDITEWKKTEENLKIASSELDIILENAMVGIAFIQERKLIRVNHKFELLFDYDREDIEGSSMDRLYLNSDVFKQVGEQIYPTLEQGESFESEIELVKKNGDTFWCALSGKAISPENPHEGSIWLFEDVTVQREQDEKLRRLASIDSLTGLPNRSVFNDRLEHAIHKSARNGSQLAVFFLDLDHFKNINDSLGHKAGDILLCEVARRLTKCIREEDTVARLGGDEFTIILEGVSSAKHVAKVADKVLSSIAESYMLENTEVNVSPSIGISLYPADGRDVDLLVRNADAAMYYAKKNGRNNFQFYSSDMNAQAANRLALETGLRRGLENNEFSLNFQPQIDVKTGKVVAAEALLRWKSAEWPNTSPVEFIPILEEIGLISEVGRFVITQAMQAYMALADKLDPNFQIAVNLSGRQFQGGDLVSFVREELQRLGMSTRNLELEITETILMDDTELAVKTLNQFNDLGITLAIDDFGTGYSSLSYLKRFPLNVLKIDRTFIQDIDSDEDDAAIVDAILAMSRHLKLSVVAEGVETAEQLALLQEKGCERVQGYYFSKPLSFDDFASFIEERE